MRNEANAGRVCDLPVGFGSGPPPNKRMNRSRLAFASFVTNYEFMPNFRPGYP
jgi:hypothetical protein